MNLRKNHKVRDSVQNDFVVYLVVEFSARFADSPSQPKSLAGACDVGKYDHLTLPRLQAVPDFEDSTKHERVKAVKQKIVKKEIGVDDLVKAIHNLGEMTKMLNRGSVIQAYSLAAEYSKTRYIKDALKGVLKEINDHVEAYKQLLVDQYEVEATKSLKLATDDTIRIQYEPWLSVDEKSEFRKWCVRHGYEQQLALPWPTANSIAKDLLLSGQNEPDGTRAYMITKVVFTKG